MELTGEVCGALSLKMDFPKKQRLGDGGEKRRIQSGHVRVRRRSLFHKEVLQHHQSHSGEPLLHFYGLSRCQPDLWFWLGMSMAQGKVQTMFSVPENRIRKVPCHIRHDLEFRVQGLTHHHTMVFSF